MRKRMRIQPAAFTSIRVGISRGQRMRAFLPPSSFLLFSSSPPG
jgi:hypothetical protein